MLRIKVDYFINTQQFSFVLLLKNESCFGFPSLIRLVFSYSEKWLITFTNFRTDCFCHCFWVGLQVFRPRLGRFGTMWWNIPISHQHCKKWNPKWIWSSTSASCMFQPRGQVQKWRRPSFEIWIDWWSSTLFSQWLFDRWTFWLCQVLFLGISFTLGKCWK